MSLLLCSAGLANIPPSLLPCSALVVHSNQVSLSCGFCVLCPLLEQKLFEAETVCRGAMPSSRLGVLSGPTPRAQRCSLALPPASLEGQRSACPGRKPWHQGSECPSLEGAFGGICLAYKPPSLQPLSYPEADQLLGRDPQWSSLGTEPHSKTQKTAVKEDTENSSLCLNFKTTRGIKVRTHSNTSHQPPHTLLPHPTHPSPGPLCIPSSSPSRASSGTSPQPPACASRLPFLPSSVSHARSSDSSQFKIWDQAGTWWVEGRSGGGNVPATVPNM